MKTNAATINNNLKLFWLAVGGKEDIAYNNCKMMLQKFDEMEKYTYSEMREGIHGRYDETIFYNFAQLFV